MTIAAMRRLVTLADLAGTFVFAAEGALLGVHAHLDLLGVAIVAFLAALGGGMVRDVLLGAYPLAAMADRRYPVAVLLGVMGALLAGDRLGHWQAQVALLDAAGLALFAASGTAKAELRETSGFASIVMGMLTATGGGVLRDLMLGSIPAILRTGFYASVTIAEAALIVCLRRAGMAMAKAAVIGAGAGFLLRLAAMAGDWHLPRF